MSTPAVDSATAALANTSLADTLPAATEAGKADAGSQSAAEGRRLYIGNLAYATTEGELKEFFKGYLVEAVSIPISPRNNRPVGYAFVDLSTSSESERAIAELHNKTVSEHPDRKVAVQLARKPDEVSAANGDDKARGSVRGRGRGRGRAGRGRGGRNAEGELVAEPTEQATPLAETTNEGTAAAPDADKSAVRPRRNRGPPEDGIPSKSKIMVANLPYDLSEAKLLELFKDYSPSSAKLALRPIPRFMVKKLQARGETRKGRGFAFVTLASEELQQKAIADMNGKDIDGRELAVKVAIDSPGKEDDALAKQADAETAKENGFPSTTEGSANADATVAGA